MSDGEPLFTSAHAALVFAFEHTAQTYDRPVMNRVAAPAAGTGKGLGGLDGAAQAGMIRHEVRAFGQLIDSALVARHAPRYIPCSCGAPCCSRKRPNREWVDAVAFLAEHMRQTALSRFSTNGTLRREYVGRFFAPRGLRKTVEQLAAEFDKDRGTISTHYGAVAKELGGTEARRGKPGEVGLDGIARARAERSFQELGWIPSTS